MWGRVGNCWLVLLEDGKVVEGCFGGGCVDCVGLRIGKGLCVF